MAAPAALSVTTADATAAMFEQRLKTLVVDLRRSFAQLPDSHVLHQLARDAASAQHIDRLLHEAVENVLASAQERTIRAQQTEIASLRQENAASRERCDAALRDLRASELKVTKLRQREAALLKDVSVLEQRLQSTEATVNERNATLHTYQTKLEHTEEVYEQLQADFKETHRAFMASLVEGGGGGQSFHDRTRGELGADDLVGHGVGVSFMSNRRSRSAGGHQQQGGVRRGGHTLNGHSLLNNTTMNGGLNATTAGMGPFSGAGRAGSSTLLAPTSPFAAADGGGAAGVASTSQQLAADATLHFLHNQLPEVRSLRAHIASLEAVIKHARGAVASVLTIFEGGAGRPVMLSHVSANTTARGAGQPPSTVVIERLAGCCQGLLDACSGFFEGDDDSGLRRIADCRVVLADMADGLKHTHKKLKQSLREQSGAIQALRETTRREVAEKAEANKRLVAELDRHKRSSEMVASELQGIKDAKKEQLQEERLSKLLSTQIETALKAAGVTAQDAAVPSGHTRHAHHIPYNHGPSHPANTTLGFPGYSPDGGQSGCFDMSGIQHQQQHVAAQQQSSRGGGGGDGGAPQYFSSEHHLSRVEHMEILRSAEAAMLTETRSFVAEKERSLAADHAKQASTWEGKLERLEGDRERLREQLALSQREVHDARRETTAEADRRAVAEQAVAVLKSENARVQQQLLDKLSEMNTSGKRDNANIPSGLQTPGYDPSTPYGPSGILGSPHAHAENAMNLLEQLHALVVQTHRAASEGLMNVSVECQSVHLRAGAAKGTTAGAIQLVAQSVAEALQSADPTGLMLSHHGHAPDHGMHRMAQGLHAELATVKQKIAVLAKASGVLARHVVQQLRCGSIVRELAQKARVMARMLRPLQRAVETFSDTIEQETVSVAAQITAAVSAASQNTSQLADLRFTNRVGSVISGITPYVEVSESVVASLRDPSISDRAFGTAVNEWDRVIRSDMVLKSMHDDVLAQKQRVERREQSVAAELDQHLLRAAEDTQRLEHALEDATAKIAGLETKVASEGQQLTAADADRSELREALITQKEELHRVSKELAAAKMEKTRLSEAMVRNRQRCEDDMEAAAASTKRLQLRVGELEGLLDEERARVGEAMNANSDVHRAEAKQLQAQLECVREEVARLQYDKEAKASEITRQRAAHEEAVAELQTAHRATLARLQSEAALNEKLTLERSEKDRELVRLSLRCDRSAMGNTLSASRLGSPTPTEHQSVLSHHG